MSNQYHGSRVRPSGGIELFAWYFMRVSGIVLLFMALIHYGIMHVLNDIHAVNYAFVVSRFANPFWKSYDLVMLLLAMLHGVNGFRYAIDDYIHNQGKRVVALSILYILTFVFLVMGTLAITTFSPTNKKVPINMQIPTTQVQELKNP